MAACKLQRRKWSLFLCPPHKSLTEIKNIHMWCTVYWCLIHGGGLLDLFSRPQKQKHGIKDIPILCLHPVTSAGCLCNRQRVNNPSVLSTRCVSQCCSICGLIISVKGMNVTLHKYSWLTDNCILLSWWVIHHRNGLIWEMYGGDGPPRNSWMR